MTTTTRKGRPPASAVAGSPSYNTHVTTWYQGSGTRPVPERPWSSYVEHVECDHKHPTPELAERCGDGIARRRAAELAAEALRDRQHLPCDQRVGNAAVGFHDEEPAYIAYCAAHLTAATHLHPAADAAACDPWECPWAPYVRESA
jgi:hypothetical protein